MGEAKKLRDISELLVLFNNTLKEQQFSGYPKELYEPIEYILGLGGKRVRPVMMLLACDLFGNQAEKALPQAIAIELFHNFTLIHDDIMDQAPLRRGLPTVHEKFSRSTAILSGDALLVYAYKFLMKTEAVLLPQILSLFNDCAIKVCEGQQLDMNFELTDSLSEEDYLRMIELKTATLVATTLKMGAMIGGASSSDAELIYHFGRHLGISFQLKDDWLDTFGDTEKFGKQSGGDIIQNKKTILLIEALNRADESTRKELLHWYSDLEFDPKEKVNSVLKIFNRLEVSEITRLESEGHFKRALEYLSDISLSEERKNSLHRLAYDLINRDH